MPEETLPSLKESLLGLLLKHPYNEVVKILSEIALEDSKFFSANMLSHCASQVADSKLTDWNATHWSKEQE